MSESRWEDIYSRGEQLNRYPYSDIVSFYYRNRASLKAVRPTALDVGCGSGVHAAFLAENGLDVLAIDNSRSALIAAQNAYPDPHITFETADLATFEPGTWKFDLVIDRCSSTHTTQGTVETFYQNLRKALKPGALVFWQGFAWDNSGRLLGEDNGDGSWNNFRSGVFQQLGRTAFFRREDVTRVFSGYEIKRLRHHSDTNVLSGESHSSWIVEAEFKQ